MSVFVDRVYETTATTGTGAITMAGAVLGYFTFAAKLANPSTVDYCIVDLTTGDFEVGRGTWTTTLARTTILASSNAGAAVNFAAGTKQVFVTAAASSIANLLEQNTFAQGTLTASAAQTFTQTWNNVAVTFTAWFLNITDTTSATASLLMDLQVGSVSKFSVNKSGAVYSGTDGTASLVAFGRSTSQNTGMYFPGTNQVGIVANGVSWQFSSSALANQGSTGASDLGTSTKSWGRIYFDATNTAPGTTGNQTINKASGRVNIAAAGTTVTVTCSKCAASSQVFAVCVTNDTTAYVKNVVPAAGSFVINLGAAATAETAVAFQVIN